MQHTARPRDNYRGWCIILIKTSQESVAIIHESIGMNRKDMVAINRNSQVRSVDRNVGIPMFCPMYQNISLSIEV